MSLARSFGTSAHPRHVSRFTAHQRLWHGPMSRRAFMRTAAGATGVVLGSGLWMPALAKGGKGPADPRPIPGGTDLGDLGFFHFFFPGRGNEPSSITDFRGRIGVADVEGTGIGTDPETGDPIPLVFAADVRFMAGKYIGLDGKHHRGTFGFI
jgi:hypothetical protein